MSLYRFTQILNRITYPGLIFQTKKEGDHWHVRVRCPQGTDNTDPTQALPWNGRWWRLSEHMTDGEVVQTAFMAVTAAEEHERRERFLYRGVSVFDPHYDIERLVELRRGPDGGLKERSHGPVP